MLGAYSIRALIGAGGMGVVYRAHDSKLRRDVAVKVLPHSVASDAERRERLRQEAHLLAALNHPAIASIYDLHDAEAIVAIVMELVEGPTLADRIAAGPLPVPEALTIASQIADALDAAHEKGIVHRDLKPANIKLTSDGRVKVLDFGLAKALQPRQFVDGRTQLTDDACSRSRSGVIRDRRVHEPRTGQRQAVDKRGDIWAFGVRALRDAHGPGAFAGKRRPGTCGRARRVNPMVRAPGYDAASNRGNCSSAACSGTAQRLRDIGDARLELDGVRSGEARPAAHITSSIAVRFQRLTDFVGLNEAPAISPDGKMVAFVSRVAGRRQIWIRLLAGGGPPLQVTRADADHEQPRWAPDSSALIYYTRSDEPDASGTLWEIPALGGPARPIVPALGGGDISHDGRRIAVFQAIDGRVELALVSRDGTLVGLCNRCHADELLPSTMVA